jgi:hypothetical protein
MVLQFPLFDKFVEGSIGQHFQNPGASYPDFGGKFERSSPDLANLEILKIVRTRASAFSYMLLLKVSKRDVTPVLKLTLYQSIFCQSGS